MSVQVENLEKSMAKLTIEVEAEKFENAIEKAYQKQKNKISIQGFRKGKAPRAIIEKMYGAGIFYEDAANALIPDAYEAAAEESDLDIVSRPEIDVTQIEKGKSFIFTATVAVKPEITLGAYKGIEVEKTDTSVSDEDVEAEIKKTLEQNARTVEVTDRPVADGDTAVIDFTGYVDDEAFEGGSGKDFSLVIGSHSFIDNFEEQLIGKNIGDDVDVNVTFPENYQAEHLAGKPALFKVKIQAIKGKEYPELNDDLVQDISEFENVADYKADVRKQLEQTKEKHAKTVKEDAVVDQVIENAQVELPDPMVDTQARRMVDELARNIQRQGLSMDMYMQYTGMTLEKLLEQARPQAIKNIKTRLAMEAVAKAENITVSEEELNAEFEKMANAYKMDVEELKKQIDEKAKKELTLDLSVQKAITLVADAAVEK